MGKASSGRTFTLSAEQIGKPAILSVPKTSRSKASKAGLLFPVPKLNKRMQKAGYTSRVGATAPIYLSAIVEYISKELIDQAALTCLNGGKHKRMTPRDVLLAIRTDTDLNRLFAGHRSLVGDRLKRVADDLQLESDKKYKQFVKENPIEA